MMDREIKFTFKRKDYEAIYFKNDEIGLFFGRTTKQPFVFAIIGLIGLFVFALYAIRFGMDWLLFGICIAIFGFVLVRYFTALARLLNWKRRINLFLDVHEKIISHKIICSEDSVCMIENNSKKIIPYSSFYSATLNDEYIWLEGKDPLLLPASSFLKRDYLFLSDLFYEKIMGRRNQ